MLLEQVRDHRHDLHRERIPCSSSASSVTSPSAVRIVAVLLGAPMVDSASLATIMARPLARELMRGVFQEILGFGGESNLQEIGPVDRGQNIRVTHQPDIEIFLPG